MPSRGVQFKRLKPLSASSIGTLHEEHPQKKAQPSRKTASGLVTLLARSWAPPPHPASASRESISPVAELLITP